MFQIEDAVGLAGSPTATAVAEVATEVITRGDAGIRRAHAARVRMRETHDMAAHYKIKCPECGGGLTMQEGCRKCHSCGWSAC
jgi:hypothetical protein